MSMEGVSEALDLHPRVAYDLTRRGLLWTNEYRYPPSDDGSERGGSIDFLAVDPKDGTTHIVECKTSVQSLDNLESQINRYCKAAAPEKLRKEVYAFHVSLDQVAWLKDRDIHTHTVSWGAPKFSVGTSWQVWQDIQTVFHFWNYGWMLPRVQFHCAYPWGLFEDDISRHHRIHSQVKEYRECLASGDFWPYLDYLYRQQEAYEDDES